MTNSIVDELRAAIRNPDLRTDALLQRAADWIAIRSPDEPQVTWLRGLLELLAYPERYPQSESSSWHSGDGPFESWAHQIAEEYRRGCRTGEAAVTNPETDHERWLRETWELIEANAAQTDQGHKVALSPRGCAALLAERRELQRRLAQADAAIVELAKPDEPSAEPGRCPKCSRWLEERCAVCGPVETSADAPFEMPRQTIEKDGVAYQIGPPTYTVEPSAEYPPYLRQPARPAESHETPEQFYERSNPQGWAMFKRVWGDYFKL